MTGTLLQDSYASGYADGFDAGVRWLEEVIAETQRVAVRRALQGIDLRAAGRYNPGIAE